MVVRNPLDESSKPRVSEKRPEDEPFRKVGQIREKIGKKLRPVFAKFEKGIEEFLQILRRVAGGQVKEPREQAKIVQRGFRRRLSRSPSHEERDRQPRRRSPGFLGLPHREVKQLVDLVSLGVDLLLREKPVEQNERYLDLDSQGSGTEPGRRTASEEDRRSSSFKALSALTATAARSAKKSTTPAGISSSWNSN